MLIKETWIDATEKCNCGDSDFYEPFTDNIKTLFKAFQKEYGKCVSGMYIGNKQIGWVFEKKRKYEDCNKKYLAQTWVEIHEKKPTVTTVYHYYNLK